MTRLAAIVCAAWCTKVININGQPLCECQLRRMAAVEPRRAA